VVIVLRLQPMVELGVVDDDVELEVAIGEEPPVDEPTVDEGVVAGTIDVLEDDDEVVAPSSPGVIDGVAIAAGDSRT